MLRHHVLFSFLRLLAAHQSEKGSLLCQPDFMVRCVCAECNTFRLQTGRKLTKHRTYTHTHHTGDASAICLGYRGEHFRETATYLTVSPDVVLFQWSEQSHVSALRSLCVGVSMCRTVSKYVCVSVFPSICGCV